MDFKRLDRAFQIASEEERLPLEMLISAMSDKIIDKQKEKVSNTSSDFFSSDSDINGSNSKQEEIRNVKTSSSSSKKTSCRLKAKKIITKGSWKIKLNQVEDSKNYIDEAGFVYSPNNSKDVSKKMYLRCKYSNKNSCTARAIVKDYDLNNATLTQRHTHKVHRKDFYKTKYDKKMENVLIDNRFLTTREAYIKVRDSVQINNNDIKHVPLRTSYKSFVSRRRFRWKPKIPKSFHQFQKYINEKKYRKIYCFDKQDKLFYRGIWGNDDKHIETTSEDVEILVDATMKIVPRNMELKQLLVINFLYKNRAYPLAFVFMKKKDIKSYNILFKNLKGLFNVDITKKISKCMADYEAALRNSILKNFPDTFLCGCWYHYIQAILKIIKKFGLMNDDRFDRHIPMVCCIALLPNDYIAEGFSYVDKLAPKTKQWKRFSKYWKKQWQEANISVYGLRNRTNNFSETLNRSTNLLNVHPHKDIWSAIITLINVEDDKSCELIHHIHGKIFPKNIKGYILDMNRKILNSAIEFDKHLNVGYFLDNVTYSTDGCFDLSDDEIDEDFEDGDYEFAVVVANHFDKSCNYVVDVEARKYVDFFKKNDETLKRKILDDRTTIIQKRIRLF